MYTKAQCDCIWSRFAEVVKQANMCDSMQSKWEDMRKHSTQVAKLIQQGGVGKVYVAKVNKKLFDN